MIHHEPVLRAEVVEALQPKAGVRFLDLTFGGGGHSGALLQAADEVTVIAADRDPEAVQRARKFQVEVAKQAQADGSGTFRILDINFAHLSALADDPVTAKHLGQFDGILADLGVSSFHFDTGERGFSFRLEAPLDMRMDPRTGIPASAFLEQASRDELVRAIRDYGEEPRWHAVLKAIEAHRGTERLQTTTTFADLLAETLHRKGPPPRIHPATRTFQGLRIAVNAELEALELMLPAAFGLLKQGGRLAIISFHSLEDRIVKRAFNRLAGRPEHGRDKSTQMERKAVGKLLTRKPISPSEIELERNPRARSARLRVIEKLETPS